MPPRSKASTDKGEGEMSGREAASAPSRNDRPNPNDKAVPFEEEKKVAPANSAEAGDVIVAGGTDEGTEDETPRFASGRGMSSTNVDPDTGVAEINDGAYENTPEDDDPTVGPGGHYYAQRQALRHSGKTSEEVNEIEREQRKENRAELFGNSGNRTSNTDTKRR